MKVLAAGLLLLATSIHAETASFRERARHTVEIYAQRQGGYESIAARLYLHQDADWCSKRLLELLKAGPTGDMFWMFPVTAVAYLDHGQLTDEARRALRQAWKTYMPYRGDTENHWVMYYASLYLMAQLWPGEPGSEWFTGKSSDENMREAGEWLNSWVKLTTSRGQGEYDSPHYMAMFLIPVSYLAGWAKDPAMRKRAAMMLDYLIADYAAESLDGIYAGAHSRVYERQLVEKWANVSSDFGWLWFGQGRPLSPVSAYLLPRGQPIRAAGGFASDRHGSVSPLYALRAQAHAEPLALLRRTARPGLQDHLYAPRVRGRLGSGRGPAAHSAALLGRDLECAGRARRQQHVLHRPSVFVNS
jgi:hypothetical protein